MISLIVRLYDCTYAVGCVRFGARKQQKPRALVVALLAGQVEGRELGLFVYMFQRFILLVCKFAKSYVPMLVSPCVPMVSICFHLVPVDLQEGRNFG